MSIKVCLITSNVGSLFEKSPKLRDNWQDSFTKLVTQEKPDFIGLHLQEFGGKSRNAKFSKISGSFIHKLIMIMSENYSRGFVYVDGNLSSKANYTALANLYFVRNNINDPQIYDFASRKFTNVTCYNVSSKIDSDFVNKQHFPLNLQINNNPSRKGFIHTNWIIGGQTFNFVNVHLFHDESNVVSFQSVLFFSSFQSPSVYVLQRNRALNYIIDDMGDAFVQEKLFIFGDFNFRVDLYSYLGDNFTFPQNSDSLCFHNKCSNSQCTIEIADKMFKLRDTLGNDLNIMDVNCETLKKYDNEMIAFNDILYELPIHFLPSYAYSDKEEGQGSKLEDKRCPSWCDRVLYNGNVRRFLEDCERDLSRNQIYGVYGMDIPVGDHKPVYLTFEFESTCEDVNSNPLKILLNDINIDCSNNRWESFDLNID